MKGEFAIKNFNFPQINTDDDAIKMIDQIMFSLRYGKWTPLKIALNNTLTSLIKEYKLNEDFHNFASIPKMQKIALTDKIILHIYEESE